MDGYPYISSDGKELWFTRTYMGTPAVLRSLKVNGIWSEPEMIVSQFAGEPTLDDEGNLYFVHHYYEDNVMIEADIYVAYRK
jgi:rhamnogalacturonyl hydrolase YesR